MENKEMTKTRKSLLEERRQVLLASKGGSKRHTYEEYRKLMNKARQLYKEAMALPKDESP